MLADLIVLALVLTLGAGWATSGFGAAGPAPAPAVAEADCGPGSLPETSIQGRVPKADYVSGRAENHDGREREVFIGVE